MWWPRVVDHIGRRLARWFPPPATIPGAGPLLVVDARGACPDEIAKRLPSRELRCIVVVDEGALTAVRGQHLVYEYLPRASGVPRSHDDLLVERLGWFREAYGSAELRGLEDLPIRTDPGSTSG